MPKRVIPLTASQVQNAKPGIHPEHGYTGKPYKLRDGSGLFLLVNPDGSKLWRLDYRRPVTGKQNTIGLGAYRATGLGASRRVGLADARNKRDEAHKLLENGIDPSEQRKADEANKIAAMALADDTFEVIAREWLARKSAHEWGATQTEKETRNLENHVFPRIGQKPVSEIGVSDLSPILLRLADAGHHELAHRVRRNLSRIFVYAAATERMDKGTNPAEPLKELLPPRRPAKRMPTIIDPARVGELLRAIDTHSGSFIVGCALKLSTMWACRPGEIRQAEWSHVELEGEAPTMTLPPSIRKLRRVQKENPDTQPHIVPLSTQAVAILRELHAVTGRGRYVFPGMRDPKRPMSEAAVTAALARLGFKGEMVAHGFRHMAKTLLRELGWSREATERQLSHAVPGVEGRYDLSKLLPERRRMMQAWADYLDALRTGANVVPINRKAG